MIETQPSPVVDVQADPVVAPPATGGPLGSAWVKAAIAVVLIGALAAVRVFAPFKQEFVAPKVEDFDLPGLFGTTWLTKPMLQLVIALLIVALLWVLASRKLSVVPKKGQWLFEQVYEYIETTVGKEILGHEYKRWMPLLLACFCLIIINNWFGEFFYFMFPTFSNIGYVYGMVLVVFCVYVGAGIKAHGPGYFKKATMPPGVPAPLYVLIVPLEILSVFIVRPLTLSMRLFANMFAGHMTVVLFVTGGTVLFFWANNLVYNLAGGLAWLLSMAMIALELFIGFLQAYIFTILTAQYVASSISAGH